jgi:hypothetical protein
MRLLAHCTCSSPSVRSCSTYCIAHSQWRNRLTQETPERPVHVFHYSRSLQQFSVRVQEKLSRVEAGTSSATIDVVSNQFRDTCSSDAVSALDASVKLLVLMLLLALLLTEHESLASAVQPQVTMQCTLLQKEGESSKHAWKLRHRDVLKRHVNSA